MVKGVEMANKSRAPTLHRLPRPVTERWDWQLRAACRDADTSVFFPPARGSARELSEARGKALCMQCPVRLTCLQYALDVEESFGIWGGLTAAERRELHGRRANPPPGAEESHPVTESGERRP
ncbi:WhiB family transcriptional regulator [Allosaccharopolyspora coralli]